MAMLGLLIPFFIAGQEMAAYERSGGGWERWALAESVRIGDVSNDLVRADAGGVMVEAGDNHQLIRFC